MSTQSVEQKGIFETIGNSIKRLFSLLDRATSSADNLLAGAEAHSEVFRDSATFNAEKNRASLNARMKQYEAEIKAEAKKK